MVLVDVQLECHRDYILPVHFLSPVTPYNSLGLKELVHGSNLVLQEMQFMPFQPNPNS